MFHAPAIVWMIYGIQRIFTIKKYVCPSCGERQLSPPFYGIGSYRCDGCGGRFSVKDALRAAYKQLESLGIIMDGKTPRYLCPGCKYQSIVAPPFGFGSYVCTRDRGRFNAEQLLNVAAACEQVGREYGWPLVN